MAKIRYHPLGPSAGPFVPIRENVLESIAKKHGIKISMEEIVGKNRQGTGDAIREETMDSTIEEISQTVITVSSEDEKAFRGAVRALIDKYGAPRTTYSTWGSTERGKWIVAELCDEADGWS
ncbi:MAG: hypothetical protein JSV54_02885 [Chloroflexota bacterium]|nr:MAG: hypothetical protein JSV54_02885 [Chloroflexota bacterium]